MAARLPASFFARADVAQISRQLLGKLLCTRLGGAQLSAGLIVETEAYSGQSDRASHAFGNRRTQRTAVMFGRPGRAYVYLCYGMHALFNIVTNRSGIPDAVLIRALQPVRGIELMLRRRRRARLDYKLAAGPGLLTQALGIGLQHNGLSILGQNIWLEQGIEPAQIACGPRVGVAFAGPDAARPWRFWIAANPWVSRAGRLAAPSP